MKERLFLTGIIFIMILLCVSCATSPEVPDDKFSFVFITDIHLQPERRAEEGFGKAIEKINSLNPDFVITGGDLIMDALMQKYSRADSLYNMYLDMQKLFDMPVYNTMGNHEVFGWYPESGVDRNHEEFGEKMFENRIGERYYSFDHKGCHFLILDSVEETEDNHYKGEVDSLQMQWIRDDLAKIDKETPVCVSLHIPLLTVWSYVYFGTQYPVSQSEIVTNSKEVLELFADYNLNLVLQGHMHFLESIFVNDTYFITGGAGCSGWWQGTYMNTEEGFLYITVNGDEFDWEYIDYEWAVAPEDLYKAEE